MMTMVEQWPTAVLWFALFVYVGVIWFLARCLIANRCHGIDEHAMLPGDERLVKVKDDAS